MNQNSEAGDRKNDVVVADEILISRYGRNDSLCHR